MKKSRVPIILLVLFLAAIFVWQVTKDELISPAKLNREHEVKVVVPEVEIPKQELASLQVDSLEVRLVGNNSDWGEENDFLIIMVGKGFVVTAKSPMVMFDNQLMFSSVETNGEGTELYTLLDQDRFEKQIKAGGFERIRIMGSSEKEIDWLPISIRHFELTKELNRINLKYRNGQFTIEQER